MKRAGKKAAILAAGAAALALPASALYASSDSTCYASWSLARPDFLCDSVAALAPGNDSRVNLFLLQRDSVGLGLPGTAYPVVAWDDGDYGQVFLDWSLLGALFAPPRKEGEDADYTDYGGSRCDSFDIAASPFAAALGSSRGLGAPERASLLTARSGIDHQCLDGEGTTSPAGFMVPAGIVSGPGKEFAGYLQSSSAFYVGDWATARGGYAMLAKGRDPWVAETSRYMLARVELNAAIARSFDEWGGFEPASVDKAAVGRARAALQDYLVAYPKGLYAASARGLMRRAYWLGGNRAALSGEYERLLAASGADPLTTMDLIEEIDNKLLTAGGAVNGPLLLATSDLMRMRPDESGERPPITAAELAGQEAAFAGRPELFGYLRAAHAYYVARDMREVLRLLPDEARRPGYTPLGFSRQVLRGLALAALKDRNEAGFWQELLGGATGLYQRPLVELGLAMNWERSGQLGAVFAKGSPITEPSIRRILIEHSAGPDLLRREAKDTALPAAERKAALAALLHKELSRGFYGPFVGDVDLAREWPRPPEDPDTWTPWTATPDLYVAGTFSDGFPCPALKQTAATLAANPKDNHARLCLGDFWRLNGFDGLELYDVPPDADRLGGVAAEFPGTATTRGTFYAAIIADQRAAPADKAYALYRAVMCYAPGGNNSCGGTDVPVSQRRAWFQRLKKDYPASPWAGELKYYW